MNEEQTSQPSQQLTQDPKSKKKPIILGLIILVLLAATGYGVYAWQQNRIATLNDQVKELQRQVESQKKESATKSDSSVSVSNKANEPDFSFNIDMMGLTFTVPGEFTGLTYVSKAYKGDQGVNSVQFSTKTLTTAKCPITAAPLGVLRYSNDQGGEYVATARGDKLYYIPPTGECAATNYKDFQAALKTLVSDQQ